MTEKIILKETITKGKPEVEKKPKKKYYKPRKKREILDIEINKIGDKIHKVVNSEKPYLEYKKPNWLHRKCMKLFLGWEWSDYTIK